MSIVISGHDTFVHLPLQSIPWFMNLLSGLLQTWSARTHFGYICRACLIYSEILSPNLDSFLCTEWNNLIQHNSSLALSSGITARPSRISAHPRNTEITQDKPRVASFAFQDFHRCSYTQYHVWPPYPDPSARIHTSENERSGKLEFSTKSITQTIGHLHRTLPIHRNIHT